MFTCTCALGWTGLICDTNIDECSADTSPCLNGGSCTDCMPPPSGPVVMQPVDTIGQSCHLGYICACPADFFGENCEVDVDFCVSSPCENNGSCVDVVGGPGYNCECPAGYTSVNCEQDFDECVSMPCRNGGTCNVRKRHLITINSILLLCVCCCVCVCVLHLSWPCWICRCSDISRVS